MKYYYAGADNKSTGPVTLEEIEALIKDGKLKSDPMVVPEGSADWKPLSVHTGKAPAGGPPPPPPPGGPSQAHLAAEKAKEASRDALGALKTLAGNPVGGLAPAYQGLGTARALGVGIAFCVVFVIFLVTSAYRSGMHPPGFGGFIKVVLFSVVPIACLVGATFGARVAFRGQGNFNQDCYLAGAASLPFAVTWLVATIVTDGGVISIVGIFAICLTVLMLNSGLTGLAKMSERLSSFAVPCIIVVTAIVSKLIYEEMIKAMMRSSMGGFGGFQ